MSVSQQFPTNSVRAVDAVVSPEMKDENTILAKITGRAYGEY